MRRLVLDTDVIVAAMRSPSGASAAILRAARQGHITLLLSVPLVLEYEAVCLRREHREVTGFTKQETREIINTIVDLAETVTTFFMWRPKLRDPDDEMVLETAINGQADAIVTFNRRDYGVASAEFGIKILLPSEAIRRIKR